MSSSLSIKLYFSLECKRISKNNPIQIKPINEDTVIHSKMNAEELEIYLKDIKHKSINRVKGEQQ